MSEWPRRSSSGASGRRRMPRRAPVSGVGSTLPCPCAFLKIVALTLEHTRTLSHYTPTHPDLAPPPPRTPAVLPTASVLWMTSTRRLGNGTNALNMPINACQEAGACDCRLARRRLPCRQATALGPGKGGLWDDRMRHACSYRRRTSSTCARGCGEPHDQRQPERVFHFRGKGWGRSKASR